MQKFNLLDKKQSKDILKNKNSTIMRLALNYMSLLKRNKSKKKKSEQHLINLKVLILSAIWEIT